MSKVLLVLSSTTADGEVITDGQGFDSEAEAIEAVEATREAEAHMAAMFNDSEFVIKGRIYAGDPTIDDTLTFVKEV